MSECSRSNVVYHPSSTAVFDANTNFQGQIKNLLRSSKNPKNIALCMAKQLLRYPRNGKKPLDLSKTSPRCVGHYHRPIVSNKTPNKAKWHTYDLDMSFAVELQFCHSNLQHGMKQPPRQNNTDHCIICPYHRAKFEILAMLAELQYVERFLRWLKHQRILLCWENICHRSKSFEKANSNCGDSGKESIGGNIAIWQEVERWEMGLASIHLVTRILSKVDMVDIARERFCERVFKSPALTGKQVESI